MHLLFWLSLYPFTTAWLDESHVALTPTVVYGVNLLLAAIAFYLVEVTVMAGRGGSRLAAALGRDLKGKVSPILYAIAIPLAFLRPWIAGALYIAVALMWLAPDQRIARVVVQSERQTGRLDAEA